MKARLRHFWQATGYFIDEYILPGNRCGSLRVHVLIVLEWCQRFLTRMSYDPKNKKHRWLRRFGPSLACLLVGCFLFLPAHALGTPTAQPVAVAHTTAAQKGGDTCPTTSDPANTDTLTGLPKPTDNGNLACPVTVSTTCSIAATADGQTDWLFGGQASLLVATNNDVPNLATDWGSMLGIALALLAIPFVMAGYQIILGTISSHYAGAVEIISRVILVALVAGLSYTFIQLLIQLESGIATSVHSATNLSFQSVAVSTDKWCVNAQNFFGNLFNLSVYSLQNVSGTLSGTDYAQKEYVTTLALINNLPMDILTLLSVLLVLQLLIRLGLLNFYIILSPLAIICGSLPGEIGPEAARGWARGFFALLFVQLLQLLAIGLGSQLFPPGLVSGSDWFNQALKELLPLVIMLLTLSIPRLFSVSSVNMLSTLSSSFGGAMSGVILIVRGF